MSRLYISRKRSETVLRDYTSILEALMLCLSLLLDNKLLQSMLCDMFGTEFFCLKKSGNMERELSFASTTSSGEVSIPCSHCCSFTGIYYTMICYRESIRNHSHHTSERSEALFPGIYYTNISYRDSIKNVSIIYNIRLYTTYSYIIYNI